MYLDHTIGELVEYLETEGWMENSIIVVASDNGGCLGNGGSNYPLRGTKVTYFEGGSKVTDCAQHARCGPTFPSQLEMCHLCVLGRCSFRTKNFKRRDHVLLLRLWIAPTVRSQHSPLLVRRKGSSRR